MPKTKLQNLIFTVLMALGMVYAMICYNISLSLGGMSNKIFAMALGELRIMWPLAAVLELFAVEKLSQKLAFRVVTPGRDHPLLVMLTLCSMIVCLMCPMMSAAAVLLFQHPGREFVAAWLQTLARNFPMALGWQIFFCGPLVRLIFRTGLSLTERKTSAVPAEAAENIG